MLSHETEELAFVLSGEGELRLDDEVVPVWTAVGPLHPRWGLACGRQHGRRAREHGLRVPTSRLPADRASMRHRGAPMSDELRRAIAVACRVIALEGYVDLTLGHVSAREPGSRVGVDQAQGPRPRRGRARRRHRARPRRPRRARGLPLPPRVGDAYRGLSRPRGRERRHPRPPDLRHGTRLGGRPAADPHPRRGPLRRRGRGVRRGPGARDRPCPGRPRRGGIGLAAGRAPAQPRRRHRWRGHPLGRAHRPGAGARDPLPVDRPHARARAEIPADAARKLQPQKYQEAFMDDYWSAWERRVERRLGPLAAGRRAS